MSNVSLVIVEDEPLILDDLKETLNEMGYKVMGSARSTKKCLATLEDVSPDLLLLDIDLSGSQDGIDLAHQINTRYQIPFIFLTAFYDKTTLSRAKATNPAGYIVKPWNENTLKANIEVALYKKGVAKKEHDIFSDPESFFVKQRNEYISLKPEEILYAQSYDNYTYIFTEEDKYLISHTLKSVEEKLSPAGFARVHKSYLINLSKIESISQGMLYLGEKEIPVGRTFKKELLERLNIL
jgi:DNA-binding LytR/AlgR family response regulator